MLQKNCANEVTVSSSSTLAAYKEAFSTLPDVDWYMCHVYPELKHTPQPLSQEQ